MSVRHDLERRVTEYYAAEAPSRAPESILGRALVTIDTIPQRRAVLGRTRRTPPMPPLARFAVASVAVVVAAAIGLSVVRAPATGPAAPSPLPSLPASTQPSFRPSPETSTEPSSSPVISQ